MTNTGLSPTLTELLDRVRQPYIRQFSNTAKLFNFHVEPVLRARDGSVFYEGTLRTPYRCDLVRKETFERMSVDGRKPIQLAEMSFDIGNTRVHFSRFSWDAVTLDIEGICQDAAEQVVRNWFLQWFDEDDTNLANAEGLYGVVHFMSDPQTVENVIRFGMDLGSAPANAMSELIEELCNRGASRLKLC